MSDVLRKPTQCWIDAHGDDHEQYLFWCPGCKCEHEIYVKWGKLSYRTEPKWTFNGSMTNPTFNPSLLVQSRRKDGPTVCHSYIRDGSIQYLGDCTHHLAGQTVKMETVESYVAAGKAGTFEE